MEKTLKIKSIENFFSIIIISAILFTNFAIENSKYITYIYIVTSIAILYSIFLIVKKPLLLKKIFINSCTIWIALFAIEMFCYGYYGLYQNQYSLEFHLLNLIYIFSIIIILLNSEGDLQIILLKSTGLVILALSMYIVVLNDLNIISIINNETSSRLGTTNVGNVNTTAMSYIFLLIPSIYAIFVEKNIKCIPIALIGIIFMLFTGSKKGILSLLIIAATIGVGNSKNQKRIISNLIKVIILIGILLLICYYIPQLNSLIWKRLISMVNSITNYDSMSQSSTNLRITFIITAFTKAWNKPFFGHGWGSFAMTYGYSPLYKTYLYTHNNYAEILFSFGLVGFVLYYWLPAKVIIMLLKKNKNEKEMSELDKKRLTQSKLYCALFVIILLFIDFGTVSCYSSILGFLGFSIAHMVLKDNQKIGDIK